MPSKARRSVVKKLTGVVGFDSHDRVLNIAIGDSLSNIRFSERTNELSLPELELNGQRLSSYKVLATDESQDQIAAVEKLGLKVETLPRVVATYWSFREKVGGEACLVLSVSPNLAEGGLVIDGSLDGQQVEDSNLSLWGIWKDFVEDNRPLSKLIESYAQKEPLFKEQAFQNFMYALRTGEHVSIGPVPFVPPFDFSTSLDALVRLFRSIDPDDLADAVILSDWVANNCNLPDLLGQLYPKVYTPQPEHAFVQAARGLVAYSLNGKSHAEPILDFSPKQILFQGVAVGESSQSPLKIGNAGVGILRTQLTTDEPWLKVMPASVICKKGEERIVSIHFDSTRLLADNSYSGTIQIKASISGQLATRTVVVTAKTLRPTASVKADSTTRRKVPSSALIGDSQQSVELPATDQKVAERTSPTQASLLTKEIDSTISGMERTPPDDPTVIERLARPAVSTPIVSATAGTLSREVKSVEQPASLSILESYDKAVPAPQRKRWIALVAMALLIITVAGLAVGWYWLSHPRLVKQLSPQPTASPERRSSPQGRSSTADEELKQLHQRRTRATPSEKSEIMAAFADAEKTYPRDYRFPYERAKLSIKGIISDQEAFSALFLSAADAIDSGDTQKMLDDLLADKEGDFYKLSKGHNEWEVLIRALTNNDKALLRP